MGLIKRIAVTGPESTGKSELAEKLAGYYHTLWVQEYSREYLNNINRPYNQDDILAIAKGQLAKEEALISRADKFLFCDTEFIVTKIWSDFRYGNCHHWIIRQIEEHRYDLFLLCDIDLPWQDDPLREHPDKRRELFDLYYNELVERHFPFKVISGFGEERIKRAISEIDRTFN